MRATIELKYILNKHIIFHVQRNIKLDKLGRKEIFA